MLGALSSLSLIILKIVQTCLGYLSGNHFPHPLSEEDERRYLEASRKGDLASRNALIEHNLRLVAHIVKKFDPSPQELEDLISIGSIGLLKAINTYQDDKGTRLATYASKCIENEILMYMRATKNDRQELHLYDPLSSEDDGEVSYMETVKDEEPDVEDLVSTRVEAETVLAKLKNLDVRERQVLELRYGLFGKPPKTQREIAKMLGISRSYVSRIEKRALEKLQQACQHPS